MLPSPRAVLSLLAAAGSLVACQTTSGTAAPTTPPPAEASAREDTPRGGPHGLGLGESAHRGDHFRVPQRFLSAWNAPERDEWQRPGEILAAMDLEPGATAVDLGAGTGYLLPRLSAAVGPQGTAVAADIEPAMLAFLNETAAREGWGNVKTHASAPDDPKLAPNSADAIVALNVWHHVGAREAYAAKRRSRCLTRRRDHAPPLHGARSEGRRIGELVAACRPTPASS
jgi:SAM-dependent methyltransferase